MRALSFWMCFWGSMWFHGAFCEIVADPGEVVMWNIPKLS